MVGEVSGRRGWTYLAAGEAADWDDHGGGGMKVLWDVQSFVGRFVGF